MKKTLSLILLLILFVQITGFALAQEGIPTEPMPRDELAQEEINRINQERERGYFMYNLSIWIVLAISLVLGFFVIKKMIKKNPKITNWIIHGIFALASFGIFIATLIDGISCLTSMYCGFPPIYYFIWAATFLSTAFSMSIIKGLIKNKTDMRYRTNMSSSTIFIWIIFIILSTIAELIIRPDFDIPGFVILPLISGVAAFAGYFVLGIIGYFIDKSKSDS